MAIRAPRAPVTADGVTLDAEVAVPDDPWAAVVLCHPHPLMGGDMRNPLIDLLFAGLPARGITALRFDFRGVGRSGGDHGGGGPERADVAAALDLVAGERPERPLAPVGWSFGGDVSLAVDHPDAAGWFAVAPPLAVLPPADAVAGTDPRPTLLAVPEHDEVAPPETVRERAGAWQATRIEVVPGTGHLCLGRADHVADLVAAFLRDC